MDLSPAPCWHAHMAFRWAIRVDCRLDHYRAKCKGEKKFVVLAPSQRLPEPRVQNSFSTSLRMFLHVHNIQVHIPNQLWIQIPLYFHQDVTNMLKSYGCIPAFCWMEALICPWARNQQLLGYSQTETVSQARQACVFWLAALTAICSSGMCSRVSWLDSSLRAQKPGANLVGKR